MITTDLNPPPWEISHSRRDPKCRTLFGETKNDGVDAVK